ncbi:MAG TPA: hypothetical protein VIF40_17810 [Methylosinus sp.]|uniref:hypothetical protein n=1 Tax=Methylosinus sp. TaxID=427 RepID=UPI002F956BF0
MKALDGFSGLRDGLREIADMRNEWAGIPMPLDGIPLVIEPTYRDAKGLASIGRGKPEAASEFDNVEIINRFFSTRKGRDIVIWRQNGKIDWGTCGHVHGADFALQTLGASDAWGIEQEANAINTLGGMLSHRAFKQYMLTGCFLETSRRSGVVYLFRRLRPTIAISLRSGSSRILAALCMHPIGYYEGSWAGAMCPTDDVIAHLALMRGDEAMLWRRCNQHAPYRPEAGL